MKLYLDIDETVNVDMPDLGWGPRRDHRLTLNVGGGLHMRHDVRWAPRMVEELSKIGLDLTWHTSWGKFAAQKFGHLIGYGADAKYVCDQPQGKFDSSMDWKFEALQKVQPQDGMFVWLDNDLTEREQEAFPNALVIPVHPLKGITPDDVERVIEYHRHHWNET